MDEVAIGGARLRSQVGDLGGEKADTGIREARLVVIVRHLNEGVLDFDGYEP